MGEGRDTTTCPYCKEEVKEGAVLCKHCRSRLTPDQPSHGGTCPYCKESINPEAIKCKHCGSTVGPADEGCGCGCGDPTSPTGARVAALRGGGGGGGGGGLDMCWLQWEMCRLNCWTRYGGLGSNDPMMQQACNDSCAAALRLCRNFPGVGIGGVLI